METIKFRNPNPQEVAMVFDEAMVLEAIKRANKLGAKGIKVVNMILPRSASSDNRITLTTMIPESRSPSERDWFED
jgi:hypothetical protein